MTEYPKALQAAILKRAFSEKEFESIAEAYQNHKARRAKREPTSLQRQVAKAVRDGMTQREAGKKFKLNKSAVWYACMKVAMYDYYRTK